MNLRAPLIMFCTALLSSCASQADRALLDAMPEGSRIRHRTITEHGVTHRVRIIQLPF
jgi:hypothetical protein